MEMEDQIGDIRVGRGEEYGRPGEWVVEEFAHVHFDEPPVWSIPGWVEDRFGETGFFKTKQQALAFLDVATA
jgi:hypothetical protein